MRKRSRNFKIIFRLFIAAVAIMLVGLGGYKLKKIAPETIWVTYHHLYSDVLKRELVQCIETQTRGKDVSCFDPAFFIKTLKNRFKVIKTIFWQWDASGRAIVSIEGVQPMFLVNKQFVLGNKKRLFPVDLFRDVSLDSLKAIEISSLPVVQQKVSPSLYTFLQIIPDSYWDRYTLSCSDDHFVLSDTKSRWHLIIDEESLGDLDKMDFVQADEQRRQNMVYDLRFKNCVCARVARL